MQPRASQVRRNGGTADAWATDGECCNVLTLSVDGYKHCGSKLRSRRQFAYQSAEKVLFGWLHWDLFTKQTGLIGNSIFQLLWAKEVESMCSDYIQAF